MYSSDGRGLGPFSRTSVQIPALIRAALQLGHAAYYGEGLPLWNGVHVEDLSELILLVLADALSDAPKLPTGKQGIIITSTDKSVIPAHQL